MTKPENPFKYPDTFKSPHSHQTGLLTLVLIVIMLATLYNIVKL